MNNIKHSILYNFKKINYKFILYFVLSFIISISLEIKNYGIDNPGFNEQCNTWDFYSSAYIYSSFIVSILFFFSVYFVFICFQNRSNEKLLQIRSKSLFKWFSFKIISIFIFNCIISSFVSLCLIMIGICKMGYGSTWSKRSRLMYEYSIFYSPQKIVCFNIITYSVFVTFLSGILGVLFIKMKNKKIPLIMSIIYFILDKSIFSLSDKFAKIIKYISLDSYLMFSNRQVYKYTNNYITIKSGIVVPIILFISSFIFFKYLINSKFCENY